MLSESTKMQVFSLTKRLMQLQFFTVRFGAWCMWVNMMLFLFPWEASLLLFLSAAAGICRQAAAGPARTSRPRWGPEGAGGPIRKQSCVFNQAGSVSVLTTACRTDSAACLCWRRISLQRWGKSKRCFCFSAFHSFYHLLPTETLN